MENQYSNPNLPSKQGSLLPANPNHSEIVKARQSALFSAFSPEDKIVSLDNILKTAYLDAGQNIPGTTAKERSDHVKAVASRLIVILQERFPLITGSEIRLACRAGAVGTYGEFYGISPKTIVEWIQGYISRRGEIILQSAPPALPEPKQPTQEEWNQMMGHKLRLCYNQVQQGQEPVDWGNVLFKFLRERNMIVLEQSDIDEYIAQAKALVIAENNPVDARSLADRVDRRSIISAITSAQSPNQVVLIRARNLALREYLMFIDDIDTEVDKIINKAK